MRTLTALSLIVIALLSLLGLLADRGAGGWTWPDILVAAGAGLAFVVGAWCAPVGGGGTLFQPISKWTEWQRSIKVWQLVFGAVGVIVANLLGVMPGVDAIIGIVVAMLVGVIWPKPAGATSTDGR